MSRIPWNSVKTEAVEAATDTAYREDRPRPSFQERDTRSNSSRDGYQVRVLNCPLTFTEDDITELFSAAGTVQRVKLLPPKEGYSSCVCFITYDTEDEVASAIELYDKHVVGECTFRVFQATQQRPRNQGKENGFNGGNSFHKDRNGQRQEKGCFECGQPGHFGRNCPTKNEQGRPNFQGGNKPYRTSNNNHSKFGDDMIDLEAERGLEQDGRNGQRRPPVSYIPPPPPEGEELIFRDSCLKGINFDKYNNVAGKVTGRDVPEKIEEFVHADLHPICFENIQRVTFDKPTPVQKHAIPAILKGRDLMACAQTGSGKTAAFLVPLITRMLNDGIEDTGFDVIAPLTVILVPTRELTIQIFNEARKFSFGSKLHCRLVYGGVDVAHQLIFLESGCHLLVATPGRLADFILRRRVTLSRTKYFVLDEADRMVDMGFGPQIEQIMETGELMPKGQRQTLMFSATFPDHVQKLAAEHLMDYIFVAIGIVGGTCTDITQVVLEVQASEKRQKLEEILMNSGTDRVLVFVETKRNADFLASVLSQRDFPATSMNGDRTQEERETALREFTSGTAPVLVATAVAARGLDIPDVKHVINYDLPAQIDEYVHRVGRTGRIGNRGKSTSFFDPRRDEAIARSLIKVMSEADQIVPSWLEDFALSAVGTNYGPEGGQFASKDFRVSSKGRGMATQKPRYTSQNNDRIPQSKPSFSPSDRNGSIVQNGNATSNQKRVDDDDEEGWD